MSLISTTAASALPSENHGQHLSSIQADCSLSNVNCVLPIHQRLPLWCKGLPIWLLRGHSHITYARGVPDFCDFAYGCVCRGGGSRENVHTQI